MSEHSEQHQSFNDEAKRETNLLIAISRTIESSRITHQGTREEAVRAILAKLQATHTLRVGDRGWVTALDRSGNPVSIQKLVDDAMLLDPKIGDPASIACAVRDGAIELGAKDELTTTQQKVEFIKRYGEMAFAKLPTHRQAALPTDLNQVTAAQYMSLPLKVRITMTESQISSALKRR
jgi:hypothetical protein